MPKPPKSSLPLLVPISLAFLALTTLPNALAADSGTNAGSTPYVETKLSKIFANWLRIPALTHSTPGLELTDVESGKVIYSYNGDRRFTPASTVKSITCACAFETLKPSFQYTTSLMAEGSMEGNKLNGNLVLISSQDPTMMRGDLVNLVNKMAVHEVLPGTTIKEITGKVIIKGPPVKGSGFHQSWLVEDWGRHWMPVSSNLVVDRNVTYSTGLIPGYKQFNANSMHGKLFEYLLSAQGGPGWVYLSPAQKKLYVYHSNHPKTPKSVTLTVSNPEDYNRALLEDLIIKRGIKVGNKAVSLSERDQVYTLSSHSSKPLSYILQRTLHKSDNLYAQQILRTLGAKYLSENNSVGNGTSTLEDYGITVIHNWLKKVGVPGGEIIIYDGCGLCRKNGVSPHSLNLIMRHMAASKELSPYIDLLKANDETDQGRGSYKYKTGTMDGIRAITGILTTSGKQKLALTIMVNGHTPSIRNLRIAMSGLINQLRVIKYIGEEIPKVKVASENDSGLTTVKGDSVLVNPKLNQAKTKAAPQKKKKRKRGKRR